MPDPVPAARAPAAERIKGRDFLSAAAVSARALQPVGRHFLNVRIRTGVLQMELRQASSVPRPVKPPEEDMMVTMVGNEADIKDLVRNLLYLEHDAIAAYDSCTQRLESRELASQMAAFKEDHLQHVRVLTEIALELGIKAPIEGDLKQMLTTGKIALADLMGDRAILKAMKTNEDDTVTAYERAARHEGAIPATKAFFLTAHQDEEKHRAWMDSAARTL
jgi:rubrerythrin